MARSAYDYALDLLSARAYTSAGLRRKMAQKEFAADDIDAAITRLVAGGLLDDRKFAAEFARQKIAVGGASVRRVRQQLAQKGIPSSDASEAIARMLDDEHVDQEAAVERIALKKLRSLEGLEESVKRRRLFGFLSRKGYELDDIKRVISRIPL
jgi:regulatory protein